MLYRRMLLKKVYLGTTDNVIIKLFFKDFIKIVDLNTLQSTFNIFLYLYSEVKYENMKLLAACISLFASKYSLFYTS